MDEKRLLQLEVLVDFIDDAIWADRPWTERDVDAMMRTLAAAGVRRVIWAYYADGRGGLLLPEGLPMNNYSWSGAAETYRRLGSPLRVAVEAKAKDAKEVKKGVITGVIVKIDGGKITVKGEKEEMVLMPYWRGGMPKDGGGFDKDMMEQIKLLKVGDKVTIEWTLEEHHRVDSIQLANATKKL